MLAAKQDDLVKWIDKAGTKNEIRLRIVGVKTDTTPVRDILPGANDAAQLGTLVGGVTPANQASISANILASLKASTGNAALTEADISSSVGLVIRLVK